MAAVLPFFRCRTRSVLAPAMFACATLFVTLAFAPSVCAQQSDRAAGEALFRAGREAMQRGDYAQACLRFAESNRLDPEIGAVLNLGACHEKLGHVAEAWRYFREVVERAPPGDDRAAIAKARVEALEATLARLTISLSPSAPENTVVIKDGVDLGAGSLGVELPTDPGKHTLLVRATGHEDRIVEVSLESGERRNIVLEPGGPTRPSATSDAATSTSGSSSPSPVPAPEESSSGHSTLSYILIGVGAAGLVVSVIAGAEVLAKKRIVEDHCPNKRCDDEGYDAGRAGRTFSTIGTISFAAGAAALGGGIVLFTTSGSSNESPEGARVPNGVMANVTGRF